MVLCFDLIYRQDIQYCNQILHNTGLLLLPIYNIQRSFIFISYILQSNGFIYSFIWFLSLMENGAKLSSLKIHFFLMLCADKSFDDEESVDGNRPSSAASAFKVPAPKTSGNPVNSARKPGSAGGPKVGGNVNPFQI